MDFTQESFEKGLINLQENLERYVDKTLDEKLTQQTKELRQYTDDAFSVHQELMDGHFRVLRDDLDVRKDVERLDRDLEKIKKALAGQGFKISFGK